MEHIKIEVLAIKGYLCAETFGQKSDPCILLISDFMGTILSWPDEFCLHLASLGYFVIRYDHRDAGRSSRLNYNESPYFLKDMALDTLFILDYFSINKAHFIGLGFGGYLAQIMAIECASCVKSLILINTTCDARHVLHKKKLPKDYEASQSIESLILLSADSKIIEKVRILQKEGLADNDTRNFTMELCALLVSGPGDFDESYWQSLVDLSIRFNRASDSNHLRVFHNHMLAEALSPLKFEALNITCNTLIIHGALNRFYRADHAHALKDSIPNATCIVLDGEGHLLTQSFQDAALPYIEQHLRAF